MRAMSRRRGVLNTSAPLGRVLVFPMRADAQGQYELFPEPLTPSPYTPSQLAIRLTLLQLRIVRMAPWLSPLELVHLFGQEALLETTVERYELVAASRQQRDHDARLGLIA